jgi:hypothetical protein
MSDEFVAKATATSAGNLSGPAALLAECRAFYLNGLADIARATGVSSASAIAALQQGAGEFFDEMIAHSGQTAFEQAEHLTASRITMLADDALEFSLELGGVAKRLFENCGAHQMRLCLRFVTLLQRPSLRNTENPVGPEGVCRGLEAMFVDLGGTPEHILAGLHGIEAHLTRDLPLLYAEINELLARRNVHAAPLGRVREAASWSPAAGTVAAADPLSSLQQAVLGRQAPGSGAAPGGGQSAGTVPGGAAPDPALAAVGMAMFEQLLARLNERQGLYSSSRDLFDPSAGNEISGDLLRSLKAGELGTLLRGPETASIDVLARVFEAVFDDARLPDAAKAAIGRLQIPLLKAALLDASFFGNREHPARMLLDCMARAAVGLPSDAGGDHPVCARLRQVAVQVQNEFERDVEVFNTHAAELETFTAQRNHDIQLASEAYGALGLAQERRDIATRCAHQVVAASLSAAMPPPIADFLMQDWVRVLRKVHLQHGEDSTEWGNALDVIKELAWSLLPKQGQEERRRLVALVPGLLERINAGLDRIGVPAAARTPLLDACFDLQTAALRGKPAQPASASVAGSAVDFTALALRPPVTRAGAVLSAIQLAPHLLKALRPVAGGDTAGGELAARLNTGDWVEFVLPDASVCCGRLCWFSPQLHVPLFANPDWNYVVSVAPAVLEEQLRSGQSVVRSELSLFDSAVERALRSLSPPGRSD